MELSTRPSQQPSTASLMHVKPVDCHEVLKGAAGVCQAGSGPTERFCYRHRVDRLPGASGLLPGGMVARRLPADYVDGRRDWDEGRKRLVVRVGDREVEHESWIAHIHDPTGTSSAWTC
ncbi:unnamed protein product [Arctogadus glacialis]